MYDRLLAFKPAMPRRQYAKYVQFTQEQDDVINRWSAFQSINAEQKNQNDHEVSNMVTKVAKRGYQVAKIVATNMVAKNDAKLARSPRFY
ncbi:hypothetical protein TNCV_1820681 [Trichonephila clavipes]|nr:hypothetical protein TNCV_1820681 [Trichonephila clavipes]